jgi:hypothetical protein
VAITQNVYTIGTASTQILAPSADAQRVTIENMNPAPLDGGYSREGYAFEMSRVFTIAAPGTAQFSLATPSTGAQFISYQIISTNAQVTATLIEGATVVSSGTAIPSYNLNRQSDRTANSVLDSATSVTGGTVIATELITSQHKVSGSAASEKVYTLKPSQTYAMRFVNEGNQTTSIYFDLVFAEQFNGYHDLWLGLKDQSYRLRGGESVQLFMEAGESIYALGGGTPVRVGVIRQD